MNLHQLKAAVERYRAGLKERDGKMCFFSETGPVGMSLIDALVSALEAQQQRIEALEARVKQ